MRTFRLSREISFQYFWFVLSLSSTSNHHDQLTAPVFFVNCWLHLDVSPHSGDGDGDRDDCCFSPQTAGVGYGADGGDDGDECGGNPQTGHNDDEARG